MSRNTDQLAAEWIEARGVARFYAQQRLPVLLEDTAVLVRGLMDRLTALRLPDTPAELQERRWQFQGFILLVGAVTYADRVRPAKRSEWLEVMRRIQEFCDEPFPTDAAGMQRLREVFSSWYGDVERVLRSRDPRSETSGAWMEVV
jgi:hypothetical protein